MFLDAYASSTERKLSRYATHTHTHTHTHTYTNSHIYTHTHTHPHIFLYSHLTHSAVILVVKFLQDILDTLFSLLDENTDKYGPLVFQSLVRPTELHVCVCV